MTARHTAPAAGKLPARAIRHELERVLASATFQHVDRLKRFLSFVVEEAAAGRSDRLKEYVIGVEVFGKEEQFDPRTDPIVRVQARRLRTRLVQYYREEGQLDEVDIQLPKGGYVPAFKRRSGDAPQKRSITAALAGRNSVTVLPFVDHSRTGELGYFCKGLTQEIVHQLTSLKGLRVLVSNVADAAPTDARALTPLDAAMMLTGSVRGSADRARIAVQLIDAASGAYLWSESVDAALGDPVATEEQVARLVVDKLQPQIVQGGPAGVGAPRPSQNLAANNLYLQARYHLDQRTEEGLLKAVEIFERVIVEDAGHAHAHSGLADAYGLLTHYGVLGPADVWAKAASSAATAVMLDPHSAEAHTSIAHVKATQDWDWANAEREFKCAIRLNPRYATAHHWYAMSSLVPLGRLDEALDEMLVAQALDPISSIIARDLALIHFYRRDFAAALDECDHGIELNPHFSPAYHTLGLVQEQRQDFDESIAAFRRAVQLAPQSPRMHSALGRTFAISGQVRLAEQILAELEVMAKQRYVNAFEFATLRFALDQPDRGFQWLSRAAEHRAFELLALKLDPRFAPVRTDRRFTALVKQIGLE